MTIPGSRAFRGRYLSAICLYAVAAAGLVSSCGSDHAAIGHDAGDARGDAFLSADGQMESGTGCQPSSDAGEPQVPPTGLSYDGGVPLDQLAHAFAVARCTYWSRCSPLAPYVVSECIDAMTQSNTWHLDTCAVTASRSSCLDQTAIFSSPSPALFQAIGAGLLRYDPAQASACMQALLAQGCHGESLWEGVPACAGLFACASDGGAGDAGSPDGSSPDGGAACAALYGAGGSAASHPLPPCSTASDCVDAGATAGPYCVDGYCVAAPCGDYVNGCPAFVEVGQPCDSDPPILGNAINATPWGTVPAQICSPGRTCKGLAADGGLGVCAVPQDIGGPCAQGAVISGCSLGLTCECGACQLPPRQGPCASGSCEIGVAYCDINSGTCKPVAQLGGDCSSAINACAPSLVCDSKTNSCELGSTYLGQ